MSIDIIKPADGTTLATYAMHSRQEPDGIKASGYGRELGSTGIREFVSIKTVYVA